MPSNREKIQERAIGRDEVDGLRVDLTKVEEYLKKLILWIRIMITVVLVFSLVTLIVWNFFAPSIKDVSERVIQK